MRRRFIVSFPALLLTAASFVSTPAPARAASAITSITALPHKPGDTALFVLFEAGAGATLTIASGCKASAPLASFSSADGRSVTVTVDAARGARYNAASDVLVLRSAPGAVLDCRPFSSLYQLRVRVKVKPIRMAPNPGPHVTGD